MIAHAFYEMDAHFFYNKSMFSSQIVIYFNVLKPLPANNPVHSSICSKSIKALRNYPLSLTPDIFTPQ